MKLYQYDHCPYCVRIKMLLGRKSLPYATLTLAYDDIETPTRLIGTKMLPILVKEDGVAMAESLDILTYLDHLDQPLILSQKKLTSLMNEAMSQLRKTANKLYKPRIIHADINDFSSQSAKDYYENKLIKQQGLSFDDCLQLTPQLLPRAQEQLDAIAAELSSPTNVHGSQFSMADIHLFPTLRNLTIVKGLQFKAPLKQYLEFQAKQAQMTLFFDEAME